MTNVILPIVYYLLGMGKTIDLRTYDLGYPNHKPIFNATDVMESTLNSLDSTYYVLQQDDKRLFPGVSAPIDLVLGIKARKYQSNLLDSFSTITSMNPKNAYVLLVTEYKTIDRSLKENATPKPGWQKLNFRSPNHTHYLDKMIYGSRCISLITITSNVTGEAQILRRILTETMGTAGHIGEDTFDLWTKALKAMRESEDVRGVVSAFHSVMTKFANLPMDASRSVESLLKCLNKFPNYVTSPNPGRTTIPLYSRFKPLHDLDDSYISLEKNVLGERYMVKLYSAFNDVDYALDEVTSLESTFYDNNNADKFDAFGNKLNKIKKALRNLMYKDLSLYTDIDLPAFKSAFDKYQQGLDNATENYFTAYNKFKEEIGARCDATFLKPTRGYLKVNNDEVRQGKLLDGGLTECQDLCVKEEKCRAIGYNENAKQCLIYKYRSTRSATIIFSNDVKVYDRTCK